MKQKIKIIRKVDIEKEYIRTLKLEQDYLLTSLFEAMQDTNENEINKCKQRLSEIHNELNGMNFYA